MKKNLVILPLLMSLLSLSAQDTLEYGDLPYYYNSYYPHGVYSISPNCENPLLMDSIAYGSPHNNSVHPDSSIIFSNGHTYLTSDTLKIYGIAVTYYTQCDRTIEQMPEVAVYQCASDSASRAQYYGASTVTELGRTRIMSRIRHYTYRSDILTYDFDSIGNPINIVRRNPEIVSVVPAFEYYFSTPVVVHDTFFVGAINGSVSQEVPINYGYAYSEEPLCGSAAQIEQYYDVPTVRVESTRRLLYGGFFPIIRPLHGSDTTAIAAADAAKSVALWPNPTDGRAVVTSDDELRAVAIYDMTGRNVMRRNASGSRAEIDASALPKGCYILAATTANGVARKKLILR